MMYRAPCAVFALLYLLAAHVTLAEEAPPAPETAGAASETTEPAPQALPAEPVAESTNQEKTAPTTPSSAATAPPETTPAELPPEAPVSTDPDQRAHGVLIVDTKPEGARVFIGRSQDDIHTPLGETPLEIDVPAGTYYLRLEKSEYAHVVAKIDVRPDEDNWMRIQLTSEDVSRQAGLKIAGNVLFWPGLVAAGTGIGLIVAGNKKGSFDMGKAGYGIAAAGVVMTITGGIILGLNYQHQGIYSMPSALAPPRVVRGRSAALFLIKSF